MEQMPEDQALLIKIRLEQDGFGSSEERAGLLPLAEELISAVPGIGEFDGEEWGEGTCTFYIYGPSADQLFDAVLPVLRAHSIRPGSRIIRRYGPKAQASASRTFPCLKNRKHTYFQLWFQFLNTSAGILSGPLNFWASASDIRGSEPPFRAVKYRHA